VKGQRSNELHGKHFWDRRPMICDPGLALEYALTLAVPVFPVRLCRPACLKCDICKSPFPGTRGFHDAASDRDKVYKMWRRCPGGWAGVPTGEASAFDVLDVDSAKHAAATNWYLSNSSRLPLTRTHQTGSGGLHVLFKHDPRARTGNNRIETGIDVKANGGAIVCWPAAGR